MDLFLVLSVYLFDHEFIMDEGQDDDRDQSAGDEKKEDALGHFASEELHS